MADKQTKAVPDKLAARDDTAPLSRPDRHRHRARRGGRNLRCASAPRGRPDRTSRPRRMPGETQQMVDNACARGAEDRLGAPPPGATGQKK